MARYESRKPSVFWDTDYYLLLAATFNVTLSLKWKHPCRLITDEIGRSRNPCTEGQRIYVFIVSGHQDKQKYHHYTEEIPHISSNKITHIQNSVQLHGGAVK